MGTRPTTAGCSTLTFALLLVFGGAVHAACDTPVGEFVSITGSVDVQSTGAAGWSAAALGTQLCEGDTIRVGERSRAAVSLINEAVLRIDQNTATAPDRHHARRTRRPRCSTWSAAPSSRSAASPSF